MIESATSVSTVSDFPVPVKDNPYWTVLFRPEVYSPELIPSLSDARKLVEKARVQLRGWDFPHLSSRQSEQAQGSNWIASWSDFKGNVEYWRLYQSGQFVHFGAVREMVERGWREKLQRDTMDHLRHVKDTDWDSVPGYISLVNLIYTVTEYFEFAARICQAGVYRGGLAVTLELTGVKGVVLTTDWSRGWSEYRAASVDQLSKKWNLASERLVADSAEHGLDAILWLCECFGWMSPNVDSIKEDQQKLLSGRL